MLERYLFEAIELKKIDVNQLALCQMMYITYPEDSFENMKLFAQSKYNFNFPYLYDERLNQVAKKYDAVCTPDILWL